MKFLLTLSIVLLALTFLAGNISQAHVSALQAQASIEASRSTQISSVGNVVAIAAIAVLALLVVALGVMVAFLLARQKNEKNQEQKSDDEQRWVSGPNAHWQQRVPAPQPRPALESTIQTLLLMQLMQQQQQMSQPRIAQPQLPRRAPRDEEEKPFALLEQDDLWDA